MKLITLLFALLFSSTCSAQIYKGNQLKQWLDGYERQQNNPGSYDEAINTAMSIGYIAGLSEAFQISGVVCITGGVTTGQMVSVVSKFMRENPEKWNTNASALVLVALMRAFPCSDKK